MAYANSPLEGGGRFGTYFVQKLGEKGMTLVEFARETDGSYENLRKISKGLSLPGKYLIDQMCQILHVKKEEIVKLVAADKIERSVGKKNLQDVFQRHARAGEFDALLPHLSDEQIGGILVQMKALAAQNRRKGR